MDLRSASSKNLYELLGVTQNASTQEIRETYRELARVYHPDSNYYSDIVPEKVSIEQIELFKIITAAYQTLVDPNKRKDYDSLLRPAVSEKVRLWEDNGDEFWSTQVGVVNNGATKHRVRKATFGQTGAKPFKPSGENQTNNRKRNLTESSVKEAIKLNSKKNHRQFLIASIGLALGVAGVGVVLLLAIRLQSPSQSQLPASEPVEWKQSLEG